MYAIVGGFGLMELIYSLNLVVGFSWAAFDTVCLFVLGVRKFLIIFSMFMIYLSTFLCDNSDNLGLFCRMAIIWC